MTASFFGFWKGTKSLRISKTILVKASREEVLGLFVESQMEIGHLYQKFFRKVLTRINLGRALY